MKTLVSRYIDRSPWCLIVNLAIVYLCYFVCRWCLIFENWNLIGSDMSWHLFGKILEGGWFFDTSAIFYTNALYILLIVLPLHWKEVRVFHMVAKCIYVSVNAVCIIANLADCVYYSYTQRRTTLAVLDEFGGNTNLGKVFGVEIINHWYLVLVAAALIFLLWKGFRRCEPFYPGESLRRYYVRQTVTLLIAAPVTVMAMRGYTFFTSSRPLAMGHIYQFIEKPSQAGMVANTPFAILRTWKKQAVEIPVFFATEAELDAVYSPVHEPIPGAPVRRKNVVILIVESFASEFWGALNRGLDDGKYRGYTPFADELLAQSLSFDQSLCNSWVSIDAMPAVLSSIPKMFNAFVLTPYAMNDTPGLPKELKTVGYSSAFFHGAENSSMGFQAYSKSAGFDRYYGKNEYLADKRFGGSDDYDGTWAIWDEEFLQFFARHISDDLPEPFIAAVFTASSHHPFAIPERYRDTFPDEGKWELHKCIRYTDHALRRFFRTASTQPWYRNTIFVLCADHASSKVTHPEYDTELGHFRVPILFFDPSGEMPRGRRPGIAQQIDIMPTLLRYLGYDKPFVAYGVDLLNTPADRTWAANWHNIPQFVMGDYVLRLHDFKPGELYNYRADPLLHDNLLLRPGSYDKAKVDSMTTLFHGLMQSYDSRMKSNTLRIQQ